MKKFGFSRKDKDKDGGDRSKNASPANANPYAVNAAPDPYANANTSAPPPRYQASQGGPPNDRYREEKTPAYTATQNGGYGSTGGYGADRYGGASDSGGAPVSRYGNGGYGGFGGAPAANRYDSSPQAAEPAPASTGNRFGQAPGANRFGGGAAPEPTPSAYGASRYGGGGGGAPDSASSAYGGGSRYGGTPVAGNRYGGPTAGYGAEQDAGAPTSTWESGRGEGAPAEYGAYADRQLTAEEQEEEDIQGTKNEIRAIKQQDVSSTRNALRIAQMAEEQGRSTLERLQQQGERIHNTERNLDLASNQNRLAAEKAREIKTLNRSMFAVHVSNPFTSGKRTAEREAEVLRMAQEDRERRDQTRAAAWSSDSRKQQFGMDVNKVGAPGGPNKGSLADRAKYQFEADSEDEEMENEIDGNLDLLHGAAGRMKMYANAMGTEIESQNKHIDRIGGKVDRVDDEIALNRSRLDRIK